MSRVVTYQLCIISRRDAERLMLAPAAAGGWVAVDGEIVDAVSHALGVTGGPPYLALIPSHWDEARRRQVSPVEAESILAVLDRGGAASLDIAQRVREHAAGGAA